MARLRRPAGRSVPRDTPRRHTAHTTSRCRRSTCKLPRPTRSLPPCGGRSLLEGGALPHRHCALRPHVVRESEALSSSRKALRAFRTTWTRPGFLFPSTGRAGAFKPSFDRYRGLSRRFNSRWSRALPSIEGRELNPFAVIVPECRTRGHCPRATGARLLVAPTVLGVCEGGSKSRDGPRGKDRLPHGESERRRALLPSLPLALLAAEKGDSAPCTAPAEPSSA